MNIVVDSVFNPYTYEELIKPLEDYKEEYEKVEKEYSDLAQMTETFKDVVSRDENDESYKIFNRYSTDLNDALDDFSNGMDMNNRRALLGLKRRYAGEIGAISRAAEAKSKMDTRMNTLEDNDSSVRFKKRFKIDDFLHGNSPQLEHLSGDKLMEETAAIASKLGQALFSDPEFLHAMDGQQWMIQQMNGLSPEYLDYIINNTIDNVPGITNELKGKLLQYRAILDNVNKRTEGYSTEDRQFLFDRAKTGLYEGLAKPARDYTRDINVMSAAEKGNLALGWANHNLNKQELEYKQTQDGTKPFMTDAQGNSYYKMGSNFAIKDAQGSITMYDSKGNVLGTEGGSSQLFPTMIFDTSGSISTNGKFDEDGAQIVDIRAINGTNNDRVNRIKPQIIGQLKAKGLKPDNVIVWVDQEGRVKVEPKISDNIKAYLNSFGAIEPIYFDAWKANAGNGIDKFGTKRNAISSDPSQRRPYNYEDFESQEAKDYVLEAIKGFISPIGSKLTDGNIVISTNSTSERNRVLERFLEYTEIIRDEDKLSDNHWTVRIPGVDDNGNIKDYGKYAEAVKGYQTVIVECIQEGLMDIDTSSDENSTRVSLKGSDGNSPVLVDWYGLTLPE